MNSTLLYIVAHLFELLPETRFFELKRVLLKIAGVKIGEKTRICSSVKILGNGRLTIGSDVWIGPQVLISCGGEIIIGDNVDIAPRVYIGTGSHIIDPKGLRAAGEGYNGTIHIGYGSWICTSATILPDSNPSKIRKIGSNSIIGAGAVVVSDISDGVVAVGVPAKEVS